MADYKTNRIMKGFYSIEMGFVRSFLVEGETKALLIDTGVGDGDLKSYVEGITKLPVTVIFTHADGDHTGAAGQFDRRLMHPCEFDYYRSKKAEAVPMEPVWEGDVIDLGNFFFEVILIPGHTPGSIALLEKEKRFLIGGDSIQTGIIYMFNTGRNFAAYRASLKKLQGRLSEFDMVYASHDELCVKPDMIHVLYDAAGKIMEGRVDGILEERFGGNVKCFRTDGVAFYAVGIEAF